jgi:uncharacterized protein
MPYYITEDSPECDGWAVVKDDGTVMGCHASAPAAIDQAVAIAIAEGSEFLGERQLPDNYRPATAGDVPEGRACGNCLFFDESDVAADGRARCTKWDEYVAGGFYCNAWQPRTEAAYVEDEDEESRDVDLTVPEYIRDAAAQGLEYHREGLSGDGLAASTVREAAAMARGEVSEDKVVRASAWAARHRVDLDAEGARPDEDGYPSRGAVAHLLWGIPTGSRYSDAVAWFDRKSEQVKAERAVMMVTPVEPRAKGSSAEFRSFEGEIRAAGDGRTISGYAARFEVPSEPLPFTERIAPGAFAKSLRARTKDVRLYVNHNSDMVLASKRSGTLRLEEDEYGLRFEADLPDTTAARDLRELMRTGIVSTMSFGFTIARGGDRWSADGMERTLTGINLHEVSVVTGFPAYPQTTAAVRSLEVIAERVGVPVDELTSVLDALAEGEPVDPAKAGALIGVLQGAMPKPDAEPLIGLKVKQHDLLAKRW